MDHGRGGSPPHRPRLAPPSRAQWALSLPKRLRPYLRHNPDIAGAVLRIFLRPIHTTLRSASPGTPPEAHLGAVSFLHRFGSALNSHFHLVVLDGVFALVPNGDVRFYDATVLDQHHWPDLQRVVQRRMPRTLQKGADGVIVGGCWLGECHYVTDGNSYALNMMHLASGLLEHAGLNPQRLRIEWISASEGARFAEVMNDFADTIRELGPRGEAEGLDEETLQSRMEETQSLLPYIKIRKKEKCGTCYEACPEKSGAIRALVGEPMPPPIPEEEWTIERSGKRAG